MSRPGGSRPTVIWLNKYHDARKNDPKSSRYRGGFWRPWFEIARFYCVIFSPSVTLKKMMRIEIIVPLSQKNKGKWITLQLDLFKLPFSTDRMQLNREVVINIETKHCQSYNTGRRKFELRVNLAEGMVCNQLQAGMTGTDPEKSSKEKGVYL